MPHKKRMKVRRAFVGATHSINTGRPIGRGSRHGSRKESKNTLERPGAISDVPANASSAHLRERNLAFQKERTTRPETHADDEYVGEFAAGARVAWSNTVREIAAALARWNPNFDHARFYRAAGGLF